MCVCMSVSAPVLYHLFYVQLDFATSLLVLFKWHGAACALTSRNFVINCQAIVCLCVCVAVCARIGVCNVVTKAVACCANSC